MPQSSLFRAGAKRLFPPRVRAVLRTQRDVLRTRGAWYFVRWNVAIADAWSRDRLGRRRYRVLDEYEVRAGRRSDTVFVFGSGASLNDLAAEEWVAIAEHDTFGFNYFYRQRWVRTDFHLLRGGVYGELRQQFHARETQQGIAANPFYGETIFLLQEDYLGHFANLVVGRGLLPTGARIFRYRTLPGEGSPGRSFAEGIRHAPGTLSDVVNCAYCLGWRRIVLVGVDLYDSRYFFLEPNQTLGYDPEVANVVPMEVNPIRGNRYDDRHNTVNGGVVEQMASWREELARDGVELCVYNPRSLLADVLPLYEPEAAHR